MLASTVCNLNTAFSLGFRRTVGLQLGQHHDSVKSLPRQPRFLFGHSRFCCETQSSKRHFGTRENTLFIVQKDSYFRDIMATSGSTTASGDLVVDSLVSSCGNVTNFVKPIGVYFSGRVVCRSFQKSSMRLKSREPYINRQLVQGYFIFDVTQRSFSSNPAFDPSPKNSHASSSPCYSDESVQDMTVNGLSCNEHLATTTVSADQYDLAERNLKLLSGSCYLPHPDKEETGGEDAHFICVDEQVIGVADGVGGWADVGVNAGLYSRELMSNSVCAILDEPKDCIDPVRVLTRAHSATKAKGSSTACIIYLKDEAIHAINLGDSGFIVVRDGCTVFESPVQQHGFNFTYHPNPNPNPDVSTIINAWSFGSTLFKTIASKSESVIGTYRRDLEEFSSGLKKETAVIRQAATRAVKDLPGSLEAGAAVAQESLESVGQAIDNLTDIIAHGKDSLLANDDSDSESSDSKQIGSSNLNVSSKPYSRLDAQLRGVQCDLNTYCKEVEEVEFNEWNLGFVLDDRGEEIEDLIEENGVIEEIYNEIVPNKVDEEMFWARLFFRMYKVKKAEEARTKIVNRAILGDEEELSWDVDDEEYEDYDDVVRESGEKSVVEAQMEGSLKRGNDVEGGVLESKSDGRVDQIGSLEETGSGVDKQPMKNDEKIISEGKTDSDISVISSQLSPEEEDLGWDEIEDIGSSDEHKVSADGSPIKGELHKRLSAAADEEEDLTWDIEDEDEPVKS